MKPRLPKVADQITWASILDKPDVALKTDIPDLSGYAKKTDIPSLAGAVTEEELSQYAKKSDIPKSFDLSGYAKLTDIPSLTGYLKQADLNGYAKLSDLPSTKDFVKQSDIDQIKANADSALSNANKAQSTADANTKKFADYVTKNDFESSQNAQNTDLSKTTATANQALNVGNENAKVLTTKADKKELDNYVTKAELNIQEVNSGDFNALTEKPVYEIASNTGYKNAPVSGEKGILVVHAGQQTVVQVFYATNDYVYHRIRYANKWHEWKWSNDWN